MDVRVLPVGALSEQLVDGWRDLARVALEPNPSFEPEGLLPASRHDDAWAEARVLTVSDGGRLLACVPVHPVDRWRHLPMHVLTTRPQDGPVPLLPVLGTPLVAADLAGPAIRALLSALASGCVGEQAAAGSGRAPSALVLERWVDDGPVARSWREACRELGLPLQVVDSWERPILRPPGGDVEWSASIGERRLVSAARRRRRMSEQVGEVRCVDRSDDPSALDDYVALEASGWKGRAGTSLRTSPQQAAAFRDMCARWAADGRLSLVALEAGDRLVAMQCAVRSGPGLFLCRSAYDESFARYGPGVLTKLATAEHWFGRTDLEWIDPCCAPGNGFFQDLFSQRLPVATAVTGLGPIRRAALASLVRAEPAAIRIRRRARRVLATTHPLRRSAVPAGRRPPVPIDGT